MPIKFASLNLSFLLQSYINLFDLSHNIVLRVPDCFDIPKNITGSTILMISHNYEPGR